MGSQVVTVTIGSIKLEGMMQNLMSMYACMFS